MRVTTALWVAFLLLGLPACAAAQVTDDRPRPVGSLGFRLGIYRANKLETGDLSAGPVRQRRASDVYLMFCGARHLWPHLAVEGSIGALSRGDTFVRAGAFLTRVRVTLLPLSAGLRVYPVAPASGAHILPYLSAAGSLVLGVQTFESSTLQFDYSSDTRATLGAMAGAGVEYRIAERMLVGLYGGYQRARFSEPLSDLPGGVSDFSGPQFMLTFSYLIFGTDGGPRGEGRHGN